MYGEVSCGANSPIESPVSTSNSTLAVPPPYCGTSRCPDVVRRIRARVRGIGSVANVGPCSRVGSLKLSERISTTLTSSSVPGVRCASRARALPA